MFRQRMLFIVKKWKIFSLFVCLNEKVVYLKRLFFRLKTNFSEAKNQCLASSTCLTCFWSLEQTNSCARHETVYGNMKKEILLLMALLVSFTTWGQRFQVTLESGQNILCFVTGGTNDVTVEQVEGDSPSGDMVIPETVSDGTNTYTVRKIRNDGFRNCTGLHSVVLPNTVTDIGYAAFRDCYNLVSANIGNSVVNIGTYAFMGCSYLSSMTLPESVVSIGDWAFDDCGLTEPLYNSHTFAFFPDGYASDYVVPDGIESIASFAFSECYDLVSIALPNSVTSIGMSAFYYCENLETVNMGDAVTYVGESAFLLCVSLSSINFPNSVTFVGDAAFLGTNWPEPIYNEHVFAYYPPDYTASSYNIPEGIERIAGYAFFDCYHLTSVVIPNSVTYIGVAAFGDCYGIEEPLYNAHCFAYMPNDYDATEYVIPDGIEQIAGDAFMACDRLQSIVIPKTVTSIGDFAFELCSNLTTIDLPNSVTELGKCVFIDCESLTEPVYNDHIFAYFPVRYAQTNNITNYVVPEGIETIAYCAFWPSWYYGNELLTSVTLPASLSYLSENSFYYCSKLRCIRTKALTPPDSFDGLFSLYLDEIIVPCGAEADYKSSEFWCEYYDLIHEGSLFVLEVTSSDAAQGTIAILQEPGCDNGNTAIFEAVPNGGGHYFTQWSDGNTDNPRTLAVEEDTYLVAYFEYDGVCENKDEISLFPNPTNGLLNVSGEGIQEICVFNAMGKMVKQVAAIHEKTLQIDMSDQSAGVYMLKAVGEGKAFTTRLVKE